jgi:hypothetical protein
LDGASRHNVNQVLVLFKRSHTVQPCLIRGEVRTWYPSKVQVVNRVVVGEGGWGDNSRLLDLTVLSVETT